MSKEALFEHLKTGTTDVCQCWAVTRSDGEVFGFTDHDNTLSFDGVVFEADSGLTARALANSTGLSVDNTEAMGLLQSERISEADIQAGRFDGASIVNWLVQWSQPDNRQVRFAGQIGEIRRQSGQFQAELRGLSEELNQPFGRSFLRSCAAVLGDGACQFKLDTPGYQVIAPVLDVVENRVFTMTASGFVDRWFELGVLTVGSGAADGLTGVIKQDKKLPKSRREITLWHPLRADVLIGDEIKIDPGCDKRAETCRIKFDNLINFQGFPAIPGDDWSIAVPRTTDTGEDGGQ